MKNQASLFFRASLNFRTILVLGGALLFMLGASSVVQAQVGTASVRGTVMDPSGSAIAGAEVTILNGDTGFSRSMKSGGDGEYNFPDLPLGTYRIRVSHSGFKGSEQTRIALHVNDSLVLNVTMAMGAVSEM